MVQFIRPTIVILGLVLASVALRSTASDPVGRPDGLPVVLETRFRDSILPFIQANCVACHSGPKKKGDLDLSVFQSTDAVVKHLGQWDVMLEQLESGAMPPLKAKE